ncbi:MULTISPECIES: nucleotidyltransferase family protein [Actinomyces]|uniref:Nucleotidyltransferase domain-containing protein n=1 Tax=Actinomyces respiraculi TaxID=2744574 RepID=A0A7T0LK59_9ACTO|nr:MULTISPECIES: nucleotidyltransferase domain-containing protein [Actinomyces]QPL05257.1 nucleotidyltransferase domain-containing protein [Actinomyces respiraculi]
MSATLPLDRVALAEVCERHGVVRLRLFGSATDNSFNPATSDLDFLVDFGPDARRGIAPVLALQKELERISRRRVDLVESRAIRNPYFASRALAEAVDVYAS